MLTLNGTHGSPGAGVLMCYLLTVTFFFRRAGAVGVARAATESNDSIASAHVWPAACARKRSRSRARILGASRASSWTRSLAAHVAAAAARDRL